MASGVLPLPPLVCHSPAPPTSLELSGGARPWWWRLGARWRRRAGGVGQMPGLVRGARSEGALRRPVAAQALARHRVAAAWQEAVGTGLPAMGTPRSSRLRHRDELVASPRHRLPLAVRWRHDPSRTSTRPLARPSAPRCPLRPLPRGPPSRRPSGPPSAAPVHDDGRSGRGTRPAPVHLPRPALRFP